MVLYLGSLFPTSANFIACMGGIDPKFALNGQSVERLYSGADVFSEDMEKHDYILDYLEVGGDAQLCEVGFPLQTCRVIPSDSGTGQTCGNHFVCSIVHKRCFTAEGNRCRRQGLGYGKEELKCRKNNETGRCVRHEYAYASLLFAPKMREMDECVLVYQTIQDISHKSGPT